ncbi:MAG TPA: PAS domain-containing protein, partial [Cyclobacteriaceae bacterium]|nr:PAS domain-containing protein [Cyclobacteriaceae bacterium]
MLPSKKMSVNDPNLGRFIMVKTEVLQKLLELSNAMLEGDFSFRVTTDFDENMVTKIADNLNRFCDKVQLNPTALSYDQDQMVATFIEVISSFANRDFKQKLPISENGTIMDAIATGINVLGDELEQSTASKKDLELERNRLDEAQAIAKIGSWELSIPALQLEWSKEAYRIFEVEENTDSGLYQTYITKIHPQDALRVDHTIRFSLTGCEDFTVEHRMLCKDGSIKHILCVGEVVKHDDGKPIRWKGTMQDITEYKAVQEKLKKAKEHAEEASKAK